MSNRLIVSLSPHVHSGDSIQKNMYGVCLALVPALVASLYFFGLGAAVVLLTDPASLWDIGFQLSCAAMLGIILSLIHI